MFWQEEPTMNGWKLNCGVARITVLCLVGIIAACAHAPATQHLSILDALDRQEASRGPASCAALNATAVCEKSTRLDGGRDCRCVDTQAITGARAFRL
jgi:hypothetical protein